MRIKKILSLAVVLAMVLTVVPAFGLTAGAAASVPTGVKVDETITPSSITYTNDQGLISLKNDNDWEICLPGETGTTYEKGMGSSRRAEVKFTAPDTTGKKVYASVKGKFRGANSYSGWARIVAVNKDPAKGGVTRDDMRWEPGVAFQGANSEATSLIDITDFVASNSDNTIYLTMGSNGLDVQEVKILVVSGMDGSENFSSFETPLGQQITVDNRVYKITSSENLISNGGFNYLTKDWTEASMGKALPWSVEDSSDMASGKAAYIATASMGSTGINTMRRFVEIEGGHKYYLTFKIKDTRETGDSKTSMFAGIATGEPVYGDMNVAGFTIYNPAVYGGASSWTNANKSNQNNWTNANVIGDAVWERYQVENGHPGSDVITKAGELHKFEYIIDAPAGAKNIMISLGGWSDVSFRYGDFELYQVEYAEDTPTGTLAEPINLTTRVGVGVKSKLPATVNVKGSLQNNVFKDLKVNWGEEAVATEAKDYEIEGTLEDYPSVTVKANVTVKSNAEELLIADYKFDDNGNLGKDSSTNGYTATIVGGATAEDGALKLEGKKKSDDSDDRDYVTLPDSVTTDIINAAKTGGFSISAYVTKTKVQPHFLFSMHKEGDPEANSYGIIDSDTGNAYRFESKPYDGDKIVVHTDSSRGSTDSKKVKLTVTFDYDADGNGLVKLYENGADITRAGSDGKINFRPDEIYSDGSKLISYIGRSPYAGDSTYCGLIDEFKIYGVALTPEEVALDTKAVKVDYKVGEDTAKSVEKRVLSNQTCDFPALVNVPYNGKYYNAEGKSNLSSDDTVTMTAVESMGDNSDYVAPTSMFSYDLKNKVGIAPGGDGYEANGWNNAFIVMTFPIKVEPGKKLKSAILHTKVNKAEGNSNTATNYRVVAIDPQYVDVKNATMNSSYEGTDESAVSGVKVSNSSNVQTGNVNPLTLDLSKINDGEFLALMIGTSNRVYNAGIETADAPYLTDVVIEDAPVDVNAYLGRSETGDLTIDFEFGELYEGTAVEITREDEQTLTTPDGLDKAAEKVVSIVPTNSNIIYTATVKVGEAIVGIAKASLYSVVVNNIVNADYSTDTVNDSMVDKVNKVISDGGIYFSGETLTATGDLTAEAQKIMTYETDHLAIIGDLFELGIGFVSDGEGIYIGKEPVGPAEVAVPEETASAYKYLKIEDGAVKLSNDDTFTKDVITLSLDAVNIEFVETLIDELEAEGADAAQDFIPEL